ncbi:ankyrin repeat domain-containing protein [Verrucomicrobia bacterium]|nr:ankyrin repeat domain-containing protein [Verrucomicrobiota bacterium]
MKYFLSTLVAILLMGCDLHLDSVYLGSSESAMLGDVNRGDTEAVKAYLDKGGNVNLMDEPGMTPLHHAVNADLRGSHLEMVELLIERGANVNAIDDTHFTPLHLASHAATAALLIEAGARVDARKRRTGETLLFSAAKGAAQGVDKSYQHYLDLTKFLISKGADVNVKLRSGGERLRASSGIEEKPYHAKTGDTPLHVVARSYSEKHAMVLCELLIQQGANINETNILGHTPLDEALANQRNQTADFLRKLGAETGEDLEAEAE